jgi:TRAP-type C4-dicarboxylate transport system permease small subunit
MTGLKLLTSRILGALSVAAFVVLVIDVLWGVLTRYAFGHQAPWSEEVARLLLIWLSMLGTALAYVHRSHLGVDVLLLALAQPARQIAYVTIHLLVLTFAVGVMVYGGSALFLERMDAGQVMSTLPMRKAWMYLAVPVSGLLMTVFAVDAIIEDTRHLVRQTTPGESR